MIVVITMLAMVGILWAGFLLEAHTLMSFIILGVCMVAAGVMFAAAETRGFEGQRASLKENTASDLLIALARRAQDTNQMWGKEPLYIQTPHGPEPIRHVYFARINHEMSAILDTTAEDPTHTFNTLKQGVM